MATEATEPATQIIATNPTPTPDIEWQESVVVPQSKLQLDLEQADLKPNEAKHCCLCQNVWFCIAVLLVLVVIAFLNAFAS